MKKMVKKNQVILTLLAMMIAVAGYLNYAGKGEEASGAGDKDSQKRQNRTQKFIRFFHISSSYHLQTD